MRKLRNYLYAALLSTALGLAVQAKAGYQLEPSFGQTEAGITVTDIQNYDDQAHAIAVQPDGKVVVAGMSDNGSDTDFAVLRYTSDGNKDTTFNGDGIWTYQVGSKNDAARAVWVLDDGSILVAGYAEKDDGDKKIAVMRLSSTGYEDISFGDSGVADLEIDGSSGEALAMTVDGQGRIVIGGTVQSSTATQAVAVRFLQNGTLDKDSFGSNGYRLITGEGKTRADSISLQSDGKIILTGMQEIDSLKKASVFRLDIDGAIDDSFGSSGKALLDSLSADSQFYEAIVLEDDAIVAVGYTTSEGKKSMCAAKFISTGVLDAGFGNDGLVISEADNDGVAFSVGVNKDSTLLIGGEKQNGSDSDIILLHLGADGSFLKSTVLTSAAASGQVEDTSSVAIAPLEVSQGIGLEEYTFMAAMEESGAVSTDIDGDNDHGRALVSDDSGRVYLAGYTYSGEYSDVVLLAYVSDTVIGSGVFGSGKSIEDLPYLIGTLSVTNVTRNSAMSGGFIDENPEYAACKSSSDNDDSDDDCRPTITARGVVYGMTAYPSYKADNTDSSTGDDSAGSSTDGNSVFPDWVKESSFNYEFVRWGKTSDGTGDGVYGSDITGITPEVFYYVRAYAVLSDDTVIYGKQLTFKTDEACFIATAAYGSVLDAHVSVLRQFRDSYLLTNRPGQKFVQLYYSWSPQLADLISRSSLLKFAVRVVLMPLVAFGYFMVTLSLQMKLVVIMLMAVSIVLLRQRILSRR